MHIHADKEQHTKSKAAANATTQRKHTKKPAFQFEDNRSEAVVQRQLHEKMSNHSPTIQRKTSQQVTSTNGAVTQLGTWTKAKAERYKKHLRKRAETRWNKGKRKGSLKLVRKYVKARSLADPGWSPKLADSPTSGHHVPPLALSNKHKGAYVYGKRGSKGEKSRKRVYFRGKKKRRREAHWMAHEAEAMQGINRQTKFKGTDKELGDKMILAHDGLTTMDGRKIKVRKRSQLDKKKGKKQFLGEATRSIVKSKVGKSKMIMDSDSDDSEPESDFEDLGYDSDNY